MMCQSCNSKLNEKWNFCPQCGFMVEKNTSLFDYLNQQIKHLTKMMEDENIDMNDIQLPNNITININTNSNNKPEVIANTQTHRVPVINKEPRKLPNNILEPETSISAINNFIIASIKLPDVKSKEDIDVNLFANSVEIRAAAEERGYFKIINIPPNLNLVSKEFNNGELILRFN